MGNKRSQAIEEYETAGRLVKMLVVQGRQRVEAFAASIRALGAFGVADGVVPTAGAIKAAEEELDALERTTRNLEAARDGMLEAARRMT